MSEFKKLINRFENAVHSEAEGEYRELSYAGMQRRADAVKEVRRQLESTIEGLQKIAEAGRDFVWEPENWEAYQDSKGSTSIAWPPEFLLLAQAVEKVYGPMPVDDNER
jgi:hypothetical protein